MRITNNIIQQTSLSSIQRNLREIYRAQRQVTTGLKISTASDDPVGSATSMETRGSIRALDQYSRGIEIAGSRAAAEETVLDKLTDILTRVKEIGITHANDSVSEAHRATAAIEVEELLMEAVSLANTRYGEGFLFTGTGANTKPYDTTIVGSDLDFTTTSPTGNLRIAVSSSHTVPANHSGVEVFEDTGVLAAIRDIAIALKSGDRDAIVAEIPKVDTAFDGVQDLLGAVGARTSALQITSANLDALKVGLQVLKSDVEDADLEVAVTELMSRQTSYQAALMTTSRIMGMTLADYLR